MTEENRVDNIIEVPDIPLPTEVKVDKVEDEFKGAVKFCIIGTGQGGSRLAETFWNLGYRRVAIVNTAEQDMAMINIPQENKYLLPGGGAAKDLSKSEKAISDHKEDVLDFLRRRFKDGYDRILICLGSGGGTGAGTIETLIWIAHQLNISLGIEEEVVDKRVGVLVALPTNAEGKKVATNSLITIQKLFDEVKDGRVSPLIILDNQRIKEIYPGLSVDNFWVTANKSVCSLFHLFNTVACQDSKYTSFDTTDYNSILDSGVITFGATPLSKWMDPTDVSFAIRDNLKRNVLAGGMDLEEGMIAGCVVIGSPKVLSEIPQENLEHGFEQLSRILSGDSVIHRGIYQGSKEGLVVYTVIGGLGRPEDRIKELNRIAGYPKHSVYEENKDG